MQLREQQLMGKIFVQFLIETSDLFVWIAAEPWSNDAVLYQPYEVEQILLAENASCLAVKAFLNVNKPSAMSLTS